MYFALLSCWNFEWCVLMIGLTTFTATTKRVQYVIRYSSSQTRFLPETQYLYIFGQKDLSYFYRCYIQFILGMSVQKFTVCIGEIQQKV